MDIWKVAPVQQIIKNGDKNMGKGTRAKKKTLEAVARHETIKRQQELKARPFRSMIYQGQKTVKAMQKNK